MRQTVNGAAVSPTTLGGVFVRYVKGDAAPLNMDRNLEAEAADERHKLLDREPAQFLIHERRHIRLIEAEQRAGILLRQLAPADLLGDKPDQARLDHELVRVRHLEFVKGALHPSSVGALHDISPLVHAVTGRYRPAA